MVFRVINTSHRIKEDSVMEIRFNVTGAERKRLAKAISEHVNAPAKFLGPPTFSYKVDDFLIDRNGAVSI